MKVKSKDARISDIKVALATKNFAKLAQLLDVKTIHISERDTQIADKPKQVGEFVNTWSVAGFIEEGGEARRTWMGDS
jgi:homospermidine synthase